MQPRLLAPLSLLAALQLACDGPPSSTRLDSEHECSVAEGGAGLSAAEWEITPWSDGRIPYQLDTSARTFPIKRAHCVAEKCSNGESAAQCNTACGPVTADGNIAGLNFREGLSAADITNFETAVQRWEAALNAAGTVVDLYRCGAAGTPACPAVFVTVRAPTQAEFYPDGDVSRRYGAGGDASLGMKAGARLRHGRSITWGPSFSISAMPVDNLVHELGHVIGLAHEQKRADRDEFVELGAGYEGLDQYVCDQVLSPVGEASYTQCTGVAGDPCALERAVGALPKCPRNGDLDIPTRAAAMTPLLGNFDFDSVMLYGSKLNADHDPLRYWVRTAGPRRYFERYHGPHIPSPLDVSRVHQYYAWQASNQVWGMFERLEEGSPFLYYGAISNSAAEGTPAITAASRTDFDVFARSGSNLFQRKVRSGVLTGAMFTPLAGTTDSDPSVAERTISASIELAYVRAGAVQRRSMVRGNDAWGGEMSLGAPVGGLKALNGRPLAPAVVIRPNGVRSYIAVQADGRLAIRTYSDAAGLWSAWQTLNTPAGTVVTNAATAVTAAAVSNTRIVVALNQGNTLRTLELGFATATSALPSSVTWGATPALALSAGTVPGIVVRAAVDAPYRIVLVSASGTPSHLYAGSASARPIGGAPMNGTGIVGARTIDNDAILLINGQDVIGPTTKCLTAYDTGCPAGPGEKLAPGGLWLRRFQ